MLFSHLREGFHLLNWVRIRIAFFWSTNILLHFCEHFLLLKEISYYVSKDSEVCCLSGFSIGNEHNSSNTYTTELNFLHGSFMFVYSYSYQNLQLIPEASRFSTTTCGTSSVFSCFAKIHLNHFTGINGQIINFAALYSSCQSWNECCPRSSQQICS